MSPFWQRTHPTARTSHLCDMCSRTIHPGERYLRGVGMDGGTAWTWKECAHCEQLMILCDPSIDETYGPGDIEDMTPRTFLEAVWQMRWRHQWRHGNGELCAIPTSAAAA